MLSNLQRASGYSLRALSKKTKVSPSFLSRAMNGERFPSWEATAAIARACGADPEVRGKIWEDADARHRRKSQPETLASALRYLHRRAGSPTPRGYPSAAVISWPRTTSPASSTEPRPAPWKTSSCSSRRSTVSTPTSNPSGTSQPPSTPPPNQPRNRSPPARDPLTGSKNSSPPSTTSSPPPPTAPPHNDAPYPPPSTAPPPGPARRPTPLRCRPRTGENA
ncbi:helix-turn-helix transcriptional regulator [Streptomyces sp. NPDC048155]|uniref:helix-turn-helix domain-containing protein n=1 Tax=Streptomyces sp. NPDC048155 TaxID=3154818 RepID=UPI0033EA7CFA